MKLYCLVSGANWGLRLVTRGHWPGCFNFQQSVGQQKPSWWYDMISYHVRIEFHILIHVEIQTNASDWVLLNLMLANMLEIWHWLSLTQFLANLTRSNVWQCWQASWVWNRELKPLFSTNEQSVSLPINQSEFDCIRHIPNWEHLRTCQLKMMHCHYLWQLEYYEYIIPSLGHTVLPNWCSSCCPCRADRFLARNIEHKR